MRRLAMLSGLTLAFLLGGPPAQARLPQPETTISRHLGAPFLQDVLLSAAARSFEVPAGRAPEHAMHAADTAGKVGLTTQLDAVETRFLTSGEVLEVTGPAHIWAQGRSILLADGERARLVGPMLAAVGPATALHRFFAAYDAWVRPLFFPWGMIACIAIAGGASAVKILDLSLRHRRPAQGRRCPA